MASILNCAGRMWFEKPPHNPKTRYLIARPFVVIANLIIGGKLRLRVDIDKKQASHKESLTSDAE